MILKYKCLFLVMKKFCRIHLLLVLIISCYTLPAQDCYITTLTENEKYVIIDYDKNIIIPRQLSYYNIYGCITITKGYRKDFEKRLFSFPIEENENSLNVIWKIGFEYYRKKDDWPTIVISKSPDLILFYDLNNNTRPSRAKKKCINKAIADRLAPMPKHKDRYKNNDIDPWLKDIPAARGVIRKEYRYYNVAERNVMYVEFFKDGSFKSQLDFLPIKYTENP
jgi:hypothetical protein